jgi:hypothetical protein
MRFLAGIIGIVTLAGAAGAQPFAYEPRTVTATEVEVRCGPSPNANFYSTTKLHHGDVVEVATNKQTEPGWLAIKPPRGSISWIRAELVRQDGPNGGIIVTDGSPVLAGSSLTPKPPSVRTAHLQRGSQVVIVGGPLVCSDNTRWLPIEPHPTEVRYIPVSALSPAEAVQTTAAKTAAAAPAASSATWNNPSLTLTKASKSPDSPTSVSPPVPAVTSAQWSAVGWLRKSNFKNDDGTPIYWFYNAQNQFVHYVVAQPGTNLDSSLSQWVYLYGQTAFREYSGVRANFMTVSHVQPAK